MYTNITIGVFHNTSIPNKRSNVNCENNQIFCRFLWGVVSLTPDSIFGDPKEETWVKVWNVVNVSHHNLLMS